MADEEESGEIREVTIRLDMHLCSKIVGALYTLFNEEETCTPQAIGAAAFFAAYLMFDRVGPDREAFDSNCEEFKRIMGDTFEQLGKGNIEGVKLN